MRLYLPAIRHFWIRVYRTSRQNLKNKFIKYFQCLIPLTLGDDSCNLEEQFDQWMIKFFDDILKFEFYYYELFSFEK